MGSIWYKFRLAFWVASSKFVDSGKLQTVITLPPNKKSIEQCKEKGLSTKPLKLRLIRIELDGEVEVLITNLMDEGAVPVHVFKKLYHLRWGVEEHYKHLKQWVEIENFSGKSALSVRQDFYTKILTANLTAMAANAAQQHVDKTTFDRQHTYQINFSQALCKMKNTIVELLLFSADKLRDRLEALIDYIPIAIEFITHPLHFMASLKLLTIDWLLFVISPCHEMNMTHTEHLNLKRYGYMTCTIEPVRKGRCYLRGKSKTKMFHGNYKKAK